MKDIIVTTPKNQMEEAALEAQKCQDGLATHYFRCLSSLPKDFDKGSKVFYVEDGFVRGFAEVETIQASVSAFCSTTQEIRYGKYFVWMKASSWKWIEPIEYKGFQGWRYFDRTYKVVGGWMDKRP